MEPIQVIATIGVVGTIFGVIINYKSLKKNKRLREALMQCKSNCSSSCAVHINKCR